MFRGRMEMENPLEDRGSEAIIMKGCAYPSHWVIKWTYIREGMKSPGKGECPNQDAPGNRMGTCPAPGLGVTTGHTEVSRQLSGRRERTLAGGGIGKKLKMPLKGFTTHPWGLIKIELALDVWF